MKKLVISSDAMTTVATKALLSEGWPTVQSDDMMVIFTEVFGVRVSEVSVVNGELYGRKTAGKRKT